MAEARLRGASVMAAPAAPQPVRSTAGVRPFEAADIEQVAEVHRRAHSPDEPASPALTEAYDRYLRHVFLETPGRDQEMAPLVYAQKGQIVGFLGIVPRPLRYEGEAVLAAVSSQFAIDPAANAGLGGIALLKALLGGPQVLTIADTAVDATHRFFSRFGGRPSLLHSVNWLRPLRPARFAVTSVMGQEGSAAGRLLTPVASTVDLAAHRLRRSRRADDGGTLKVEALGVDELLSALDGPLFEQNLAPRYARETLEWRLDLVARMDANRQVDCIGCYGARGALVGVVVGYLGGDGVYELVTFAAATGQAPAVFDEASAHARRRQATALAGRMQPELVNVLPSGRGLLVRRHDWVMLHGEAALIEAFVRGDTSLSRLDGEGCLGFTGWHPDVTGEPRIAGPA